MKREPGYDPQLPFLAELESQIERAAQERLDASEPSRPRRVRLGGGSMRVPRRALTLAALVCLVGGTAIATVSFSGGGQSGGDGVLLERERGEVRLELHRQGGRVCPTLFAADALRTACTPPPRGANVRPYSLAASFRRYVFGLTGPGADQVLVQVGERHQRRQVRPLPGWAKTDGGFFIAMFPREEPEPVASVHVYGEEKRGAAATAYDCSLGKFDPRCAPRSP